MRNSAPICCAQAPAPASARERNDVPRLADARRITGAAFAPAAVAARASPPSSLRRETGVSARSIIGYVPPKKRRLVARRKYALQGDDVVHRQIRHHVVVR